MGVVVTKPPTSEPPTRESSATFERSVETPRQRIRPGFIVALVVALAWAAVVLVPTLSRRPVAAPQVMELRSQMPAHCTPLEVETTIRAQDMNDRERAVCLAIAGRTDRARAKLLAMAPDDRVAAVQALFHVAHPIADMGDDRSAGPIMSLVAEMSPDNYMAVFHAGMAEYAVGDDETALPHLERFLGIYRANDVWRQRAVRAVDAIARHAP